MTRSNNFIIIILQIIAWVIFVGLCIEAGALLVNFVFSISKPEVIHRLYQKLDLSDMLENSRWIFFSIYSLILTIAVLKAVLFYIVIRLVGRIDLTNPFTSFAANHISQICYYTLAIGIVSFIGEQFSVYLLRRGYSIDTLNGFWSDGHAFILMAAVLYVIATIFKRGVEIQSENDLTV